MKTFHKDRVKNDCQKDNSNFQKYKFHLCLACVNDDYGETYGLPWAPIGYFSAPYTLYECAYILEISIYFIASRL